LATTGPTSGDDSCSRDEHRTDRESIRDAVGDRRTEREAQRDRSSVDVTAAIDDSETISDAGAERGAIADPGADVQSRGRGAAALRKRIEDGELVDSNLRSDVRRRADTIAVAITERPTTTVDVTGPFSVRDP
jgi:hypothetical protein